MQNILKVEWIKMTSADLDFEHVTVDDIELIQTYLKKSRYEESNHNIVNMMLWLDWYPLWKCVDENWMLLLGIHERELFIYMPLCEETYFDEAITKAKAIFDQAKVPFVLSCFTSEAMKRVIQLFPNYRACAVRESYDYIYETEKLRTFAGKKLQKKRNHLNAFYNEYADRFVYEKMNAELAIECIEFLHSWKIESEDEFLIEEKKGVVRVLELWDKLPAVGGIIRIDQQIKAFTIGSSLTKNMGQINIEKADDSVRGLYQAIVKEFLAREFLDVPYVNREDDIGKENIRAAKMAYYPAFMIEKYRLCKEGEK